MFNRVLFGYSRHASQMRTAETNGLAKTGHRRGYGEHDPSLFQRPKFERQYLVFIAKNAKFTLNRFQSNKLSVKRRWSEIDHYYLWINRYGEEGKQDS